AIPVSFEASSFDVIFSTSSQYPVQFNGRLKNFARTEAFMRMVESPIRKNLLLSLFADLRLRHDSESICGKILSLHADGHGRGSGVSAVPSLPPINGSAVAGRRSIDDQQSGPHYDAMKRSRSFDARISNSGRQYQYGNPGLPAGNKQQLRQPGGAT
ncbi:unnamed protein product, partial [Notodromas monacha]